jgi:isoquinoline 1-oxidoreductase alpha subunit
MTFKIVVNGTDRSVDVDGDTPLLWVLRDVLGMTGTKFGCGAALCGACTVHVDGIPTRSCVTPIDSIGVSKITTIEAIGATAVGAKIQKAWLDREVVQCGYCQSGQIMSASALLASASRHHRSPDLHRRPEPESANNNPLKRKGDVDQQPYSRLEPVGLRQSSLESASASRVRVRAASQVNAANF